MGALIPFFLEYAMKKNQLMPLLLAAIWTQPLSAAPMDAFLNAVSHYRAGTTQVEIAYDVVNKTLDPFGIRAKDPVFGGTNVGDYNGYHIRGGYGLTDRLWLDGGLWQRKIAYRNDIEDITSWQAAAQYRLTDKDRPDAQYAVRLGIWGDSAPVVNKNTPTNIRLALVPGATACPCSARPPALDGPAVPAGWPVSGIPCQSCRPAGRQSAPLSL